MTPELKVGDLVQFWSADNDSDPESRADYGIILKLSRTGTNTKSAQILFKDGEIAWIGTNTLVVVSEGR